MEKYSVLLLYPDYLAETYGEDTLYAWVEAMSVSHAIKKAQIDLMLSQLPYGNVGNWIDYGVKDLNDSKPLLVTSGYNFDHALQLATECDH